MGVYKTVANMVMYSQCLLTTHSILGDLVEISEEDKNTLERASDILRDTNKKLKDACDAKNKSASKD